MAKIKHLLRKRWCINRTVQKVKQNKTKYLERNCKGHINIILTLIWLNLFKKARLMYKTANMKQLLFLHIYYSANRSYKILRRKKAQAVKKKDIKINKRTAKMVRRWLHTPKSLFKRGWEFPPRWLSPGRSRSCPRCRRLQKRAGSCRRRWCCRHRPLLWWSVGKRASPWWWWSGPPWGQTAEGLSLPSRCWCLRKERFNRN